MQSKPTAKTIGICVGAATFILLIIGFPIAIYLGYAVPLGSGNDEARGRAFGFGAILFSTVLGYASYALTNLLRG
jgi:hypothetical protein